MNIGLLGGTGIEGKGLAFRFAAAGAEVILGSRSRERAVATAERYNALLRASAIHGLENQEMIGASDIVFLTVPYDQAVAAILSYRNAFSSDQILVDVTVPMRFVNGLPEYAGQQDRSNAEVISANIPPETQVVGAFKTIPAHILGDPDTELRCDVFVCGDSEAAKSKVIDAVSLIQSLRPLDAGPLRMARTLERMTVLAAWLNRRYRKKGTRFLVAGV